jgi:hypothetical protein
MDINEYMFYTMAQEERSLIKIVVCVYGPVRNRKLVGLRGGGGELGN